MNENYKWNNITLNSKGIIVEKIPIIPRAEHSYTIYEIPGRDGDLTIDDKTYKTIPFTLECHFNNTVNINEIRAFLDGYGTLQVDNEKVYKGRITNQIDFEQIVKFKKFIIQFILQPIAESLTSTTITANQTGTFNSDTYTKAYPIITITCSGDTTITLNDKAFTIHNANGTYILDCGAEIITKNGSNASGSMSGMFPYIKNGTNNLTVNGTVTNMTIQYKKTYL